MGLWRSTHVGTRVSGASSRLQLEKLSTIQVHWARTAEREKQELHAGNGDVATPKRACQ